MALFSRKNKNSDVLPEEVREFYKAEKRDRTGMAWLLAIATLVVTFLIAAGLFFGGRWVYRAVFNDDDDKNANTTSQTEDTSSSQTTSDTSQTPSNSTTQSSGQTSSTNTSQTPNTSSSSQNNSTNRSGTTDSTSTNAQTVPNTGPGTLVDTGPGNE